MSSFNHWFYNCYFSSKTHFVPICLRLLQETTRKVSSTSRIIDLLIKMIGRVIWFQWGRMWVWGIQIFFSNAKLPSCLLTYFITTFLSFSCFSDSLSCRYFLIYQIWSAAVNISLLLDYHFFLIMNESYLFSLEIASWYLSKRDWGFQILNRTVYDCIWLRHHQYSYFGK